VLAGPVAGRAHALWGAEVLRIDPPDRPEIGAQHVDMDAGKYSCVLDLRNPAGAVQLLTLAATADVVLLGYRPGALARLGLGADDLLDAAPHLVVVELSAWGWTGPWAQRRGFDSIVQAACGIANRSAAPDGTPGALPAQVLDHATGYRAAAAALRALAVRPERGGVRLRLSLAATAAELMRLPVAGGTGNAHAPDVDADDDPASHLRTIGDVTAVRAPFTLDGVRIDYPFPARPYGADAPRWQESAT
jgi:crotonobetainyl-CoA:carnitine CoA-transferase CaiB-like acyl-CoA transferase